MKTLILETSTEKGLIVLARDGLPIESLPLTGGPELSKTLALQVQNLLKKHSFTPDFVAVGIGPGSYTGVRVGVSLAKALAFGWQIPVIGFCSLKAFKSPAPLLIDARIGGFYLLKNFHDEAILLTLEAALSEFENAPTLASPHPDLIRKRLPFPCEWIETWPDPHLLSTLAQELFSKGDFAPLKLTYISSP